MIHLVDIAIGFGGQPLLKGVSLHVRERDRIGLVGANGSGKTTLLKVICGFLEHESGELRKRKNLTIGYLPQEGFTIESRKTLLEIVLEGRQDYYSLKNEIMNMQGILETSSHESKEYMDSIDRYGELQHRFEQGGGYLMEMEARKILSGLGYRQADEGRVISEFSGGWQMRAALARLLLQKPEILLLDEPTNHLDLDSLLWLEKFLDSYPGAILVVSHDRYFLDNITRKTVELDMGALNEFHMKYSDYLVEKDKRNEILLKNYERQQEEIKRLKVFIAKNKANKKKAKLVHSREKMLDRMELIEIPPKLKKIRFNFPEPPRSGKIVLEMKNVSKCYGNLTVFTDLDLSIVRGDRIALVGVNGAGKSTLSRLMSGVDEPTKGQRIPGYNIEIGYFAQERAEALYSTNTVYTEIESQSPNSSMGEIRSLLGAFLFSGDDIYKPVKVLSGGEKSRLVVAKLLLKASNFLILDEPSNHLDSTSKEVLHDALKNYNGTLVIVSHDRHILEGITNRVIELDGGRISEYPGTFTEFLERKKSLITQKNGNFYSGELVKQAKPEIMTQPSPPAQEAASDVMIEVTSVVSKKEARVIRAQQRLLVKEKEEKLKKLRQKLKELEKLIDQKESRIKTVELLFTEKDFFKDSQQSMEKVIEFNRLKNEVEHAYREWEEVLGVLEKTKKEEIQEDTGTGQ